MVWVEADYINHIPDEYKNRKLNRKDIKELEEQGYKKYENETYTKHLERVRQIFKAK